MAVAQGGTGSDLSGTGPGFVIQDGVGVTLTVTQSVSFLVSFLDSVTFSGLLLASNLTDPLALLIR